MEIVLIKILLLHVFLSSFIVHVYSNHFLKIDFKKVTNFNQERSQLPRNYQNPPEPTNVNNNFQSNEIDVTYRKNDL